jgi:hypothetical protein
MRFEWMAQRAVGAAVLVWAGLAILAGPARAQLSGDLRYTRGYDLVPNPPVAGQSTTFVLYGVYPTGCGVVEEKSADPVAIRLESFASCPDSVTTWAESFSLGMLAAGTYAVAITLTMERPDSGVTVHHGTLSFVVEDSASSPPPPPPVPPPSPVPPLLGGATPSPWPPTPDVPMALIVQGFAPFDCPVVSAAAVTDSSHLALALSPGAACNADSSRAWAHSFELGLQREGHHTMDLAITLDGDLPVHVPIHFLVVHDTTGWGPPPPDSLEHVLSPGRPNPFASESRFSISLDDAADANVAVFDIVGRRVSTVFRGRLKAGTTELAWNGKHDDGSRATAGVYFYRLEMKGRVVSRRLVLLRPQ